jgi:hypothetical protein
MRKVLAAVAVGVMPPVLAACSGGSAPASSGTTCKNAADFAKANGITTYECLPPGAFGATSDGMFGNGDVAGSVTCFGTASELQGFLRAHTSVHVVDQGGNCGARTVG